jgi:3-hydroxybutyryl-CoA dehydratase
MTSTANEVEAPGFIVTRELIQEYADLTVDYNPIHLDEEFANASPMKGVIAHGTLSLGLIWRWLDLASGDCSEVDLLEIRFKRPVRVGDRVVGGGNESSPGVFDVWVKNQNGEPVIVGTARRRGPDDGVR